MKLYTFEDHSDPYKFISTIAENEEQARRQLSPFAAWGAELVSAEELNGRAWRSIDPPILQ